jgi:signal transduction histidine kinase
MDPAQDAAIRYDASLARRVRRIHGMAAAVAIVWILVSALGGWWLSDRIIANDLVAAAERGATNAETIAGIMERVLGELEAVARVLAAHRDLRAIVERYNAREPAFLALADEERTRQLKQDTDVTRVSSQLSRLRDHLKYDQLYALDARGLRVATSDWDRPVSLLGVRLDDRENFKQAAAGRAGHMFAVGRTTRNPALFFSTPIEERGKTIGVVVAREDAESVGAMLSGGQRAFLIVDAAGMVVASSQKVFALKHVGPLSDRKPDDNALHDVYGQERLLTLPIARPAHPRHPAEWIVDGRGYLVSRATLKTADTWTLLVLIPLERVEAVRPLHQLIGVLVGLFGLLVALLGDRRATSQAREKRDALVTAALNEKLKLLNLDKDRYLGIAAHDLRNPLSSMRGLAELMLQMPLPPEQQREFLETIHRTSDEMLGLVNDLLDVAVIESGKLELRPAEQDVARLLERRVRHLEPHARGKQIALAVDAPGAPRANVDPARFGQVVDNLVSNAVKFSPSGTTVRVALHERDGRLVFSVEDQGPGIPEADRKLLFRSFQKLSAQPTGGEKSTGLGLAIVKKIVDAHGGTIEVDSEPGRGTRFTVSVPSLPQGSRA